MTERVENVLIFGATSAVAQALGRQLARRAARIFLVARNRERLEAVACDLALRGAEVCGMSVADLDVTDGHAAILDAAATALGHLDLVVVAQGVLGDQLACEGDQLAAERLLRSNFVAPALLCLAAGRRLAFQGVGVLVGISSVAGDRGRQSNFLYGAAKGGFSTFLAGLRNRLHREGVRVITVKPGFIDSPMTAHLPKTRLFATPSAIAARALRAVDRGQDEVYAPAFWWVVMFVIRLVPERLFKRLRL